MRRVCGVCAARVRWACAAKRDLHLHADAADAFAAVAAAQPDNLRAAAGLGAVLFAQGKYDAAEKELRRAQKLAPDSVEVHYQLGSTLYKKGVYAAAATALRRAVELADGWVPFGLPLPRITALLAAVPPPAGFDVVLGTPPLDPLGDPAGTRREQTAGATVAAIRGRPTTLPVGVGVMPPGAASPAGDEHPVRERGSTLANIRRAAAAGPMTLAVADVYDGAVL